MKQSIVLALSFVGFIAGTASATDITCSSKKNESLYFTTGQVLFTAQVDTTTALSFASLSTTGSSALGANDEEVDGKIQGRYVRFQMADSWCSYKITFPVDFATRKSTPMFLDASCEARSKANILLTCSIK